MYNLMIESSFLKEKKSNATYLNVPFTVILGYKVFNGSMKSYKFSPLWFPAAINSIRTCLEITH